MKIHSIVQLTSIDSVPKIQALNALNIYTIRDIAEYDGCRHAEYLMVFFTQGKTDEAGLQHYLEPDALTDSNIAALDNVNIVSLLSVSSADAEQLSSAFGVTTLAQLASFPPYEEAKTIILDSLRGGFDEKPSAPQALLPRMVGSTLTKVRFSNYVKENEYVFDDYALLHFSDSDEPEPSSELINIFYRSQFKLTLGYLAAIHQKWISDGTHLGDVVHSLALAPGESRNIAVLDWYRRQQSSRDETTTVAEQLSAEFTQNRALNEVVQTTANEHLYGSTDIDATTRTTGASVVGGKAAGSSAGGAASIDLLSLIGLPIKAGGGELASEANSLGGSLVYSSGRVQGTLQSETTGTRSVDGQMVQNISDSTVQNASNVRSVMSTVIVEDRQAGRQRAQTSNVTNYNHSHALTIQYFEVLQRYRIDTAIDSLTPVLYLPFNPITFDTALIKAYWYLFSKAVKRLLPGRFFEFDQVVKDFDPKNEAFDSSGDLRIERVKITRTRSYSAPVRVEFREADPKVTLAITGTDLDDLLTLTLNGGSEYIRYGVLGLSVFDVSSFFSGGSSVDSFEIDEAVKLHLASAFMTELKRWLKIYLGDPQRTPFAPAGTTAANLEDNELGKGVAGFSKRDNLKDDVDNDRFTIVNNDGLVDLVLNIEYTVADRNGQTLIVPQTIHKTYSYGSLKNEINEDLTDVSATITSYLTTVADFNPADVIAEIEQYFNFHRYGFTKYLLANLEKEQIIDIIEHLGIYGTTETLALSALVDPNPLGLTENLLIFKLKQDETELSRHLGRNFFGSVTGTFFDNEAVFVGRGIKIATVRNGAKASKYQFSGQPARIEAAARFSSANITMYVGGQPTADGKYPMQGSVLLSGLAGNKQINYPLPLIGSARNAEGNRMQVWFEPSGALPGGALDWTLDFPKPVGQDIATTLLKYTRELNEYESVVRWRHRWETLFLPSSGVFAEAILGLSNASEYLNVRRFFNWQDSPIPNLAPSIASVNVNQDFAQPVPGTLSPTVPVSVLNQVAPQQYPMPTGLTSAFQTLGNGSLFTDMSKSSELTAILGNLSALANNTAQLSGNLAGDAAANALNAAVALGQQVAGMVGTAMSTNVADPPKTLTSQGAATNLLDDVKATSGTGAIAPTDQAAANGMGTPIPPAPSPAPAPAGDAPPPPATTYPNLELKLRLFIPSEAVAFPQLAAEVLKVAFPTLATAIDEATKVAIGGDNRGFSYDQGHHRAQIVLYVSMDPARGSTPTSAVIPFNDGRLAFAEFGPTREFDVSKLGSNVSPIPPCSSGLQPWAYALIPGSVADRENILEVTPERINVKFEGSTDPSAAPALTVRFQISAALAAESWALSTFAPAIDGDIKLRLQNIGQTGQVRCYVDQDSLHDAFPAWELYVNGHLLYSYAPCNMYGPLGLYSPNLGIDSSIFDQIAASIGEDVFYIRPSRHELIITDSA